MLASWKKSYDQPRQRMKNRDITWLTKIYLVKAMVFPVVMWELYHKEGWVPKNWCFWTMVLEKTRESLGLQGDPTSPSYSRSVLSVHWKGWCWSWNSSTLWTPDGKDPDAGKDWRREKGTREDEMVGWHHWLNGHDLGKLHKLVKDREA